MNDFILWRKPRHHPMMCLKKNDNYNSIWLSLWGINLDEPMFAHKINGKCHQIDFYDEVCRGIIHETLHNVIMRLEGFNVSKYYDNIYHFTDKWWLP